MGAVACGYPMETCQVFLLQQEVEENQTLARLRPVLRACTAPELLGSFGSSEPRLVWNRRFSTIGSRVRLEHTHRDNSDSVPLVMSENRRNAVFGFAYDLTDRGAKLRDRHAANHR